MVIIYTSGAETQEGPIGFEGGDSRKWASKDERGCGSRGEVDVSWDM